MLASGFCVRWSVHVGQRHIFNSQTVDDDMHMDVAGLVMPVRVGADDRLMTGKLLPEKPLAKLLRLIHGQPVVRAVPWVKADDGVMALDIRPECFSFSLPLLQSQKRFLASSANKAFAINRPVRFSPLLRSDVGELAKPDTKNGQDFRLAQSAQAISSSLFNLNTSQMSLIRS